MSFKGVFLLLIGLVSVHCKPLGEEAITSGTQPDITVPTSQSYQEIVQLLEALQNQDQASLSNQQPASDPAKGSQPMPQVIAIQPPVQQFSASQIQATNAATQQSSAQQAQSSSSIQQSSSINSAAQQASAQQAQSRRSIQDSSSTNSAAQQYSAQQAQSSSSIQQASSTNSAAQQSSNGANVVFQQVPVADQQLLASQVQAANVQQASSAQSSSSIQQASSTNSAAQQSSNGANVVFQQVPVADQQFLASQVQAANVQQASSAQSSSSIQQSSSTNSAAQQFSNDANVVFQPVPVTDQQFLASQVQAANVQQASSAQQSSSSNVQQVQQSSNQQDGRTWFHPVVVNHQVVPDVVVPVTNQVADNSAQNAHYKFGFLVDNNIEGNFIQRDEVRANGRVVGSYSYDDGYFLRSVTYVADRNGFRIVKEQVSPSKKRGRLSGNAIVKSYFDNTGYQYGIVRSDLKFKAPQVPAQ